MIPPVWNNVAISGQGHVEMVRRKGGSTCWFSGHLSYPRLPGELPGNLSLRLSHECTTRSFYYELPGAHSRERLRHRQAPNDDITENNVNFSKCPLLKSSRQTVTPLPTCSCMMACCSVVQSTVPITHVLLFQRRCRFSNYADTHLHQLIPDV